MTTPARRRAAIVGAGLMGRWHAHALRRLGIPITAVVDPDPRNARRLADACPGSVALPDLSAALDGAGADVVHICTPLDTHARLIREAIAAGLHVLVEKPLAPSAEETAGLLRLADSRGLLLCPVHQMPFQSGVDRVQRNRSRLGKLRHIDATFCSAGAQGRSESEQSQILADILPHPLSLFARLLPESWGAMEWQVLHPCAGEMRALGGTDETSASILISMHGRPPVSSLRLVGEGATAHLDLFHGFAVLEEGSVSRARKISRPFALSSLLFAASARNLAMRAARREVAYPGLRELVQRFYRAVDGLEDTPISPIETRSIAETRDRLLLTFCEAASPRRQ